MIMRRSEETKFLSGILFIGSLWVFGVMSGYSRKSSELIEESICGGFDMRNEPNEIFVKQEELADTLRNCTVVEGDVRLVMLTKDNQTSEDFPSFPRIREITGFLLVFQVNGLDSIGRIFPNLRVIRGKQLLRNYALTIYQNPDMKEVGLSNLAEISQGGVRITENPELCFGDMVNWQKLCKEKEFLHIVVERNKDPDQCDVGCDEVESAERLCEKRPLATNPPKYYCWNATVCQKACAGKCGSGCYWDEDDDDREKCCHSQCAGGCVDGDERDCFACRNVYHKGRCMPDCPADLFLVRDRRCVTEEECKNRSPEQGILSEPLYYKAVKGRCDIFCPRGYEEDPKNPKNCLPCVGSCLKRCLGGIIASLDEAKSLEGCNVVNDIQIRIQSAGEGNVSAILAKYMKDIQEVKHFVVVSFTPALVSLDFLKSIRVIRGEELYTEQKRKNTGENSTFEGYALSVFENENMVRLFHQNHSLMIERGDLQFHNNPLLCYKKIQDFAKTVKITLNKEDASARSNGNKAICEELEIAVNLKASDNEGFVLSWESFNISSLGIDERQFLGYQIYYKEVKEGEIPDMFEDRDACHDSWHMVFEGKERGILINQLRPNTNYAFYVKTVIVHHELVKGGISKIHIFKTKFGAPSQPLLKKLVSRTPNTIDIEWKPPAEPNGDVTHYMVQYTGTRDRVSKTRNYCDNRPKYSNKDVESDLVGPVLPGPIRGGIVDSFKKGECGAISDKCCECVGGVQKNGSVEQPPDKEELRKRKERHQFENAVHNIVFMKNKKAQKELRLKFEERRRRKQEEEEARRKSGMSRKSERSISDLSSHRDYVEFEKKRRKREISTRSRDNNFSSEKRDGNDTSGQDDDSRHYITVTLNTTETKFVMRKLKHFTSYQIKIWACQNTSAEYNYCTRQPVSKVKRTMAIPGNDEIKGVVRENRRTEESKTYHIFSWTPPKDPNGQLLLYDLEFSEVGTTRKIPGCISHVDFVRKGYTYKYPELPAGNFSVKVRALTLSGEGRWSWPVYIVIKSQASVKSWVVIVLCVTIPCVVLLFAVVVGRYLHKRKVRKKMPEYIMNVISACPDYISTLDVYKPDEWELQREDIELLREIGQGTFGKVYAGRGRNVRSICGVDFGECAVKTVQESAGHWDRLTFLMEASIMKHFDTAFIVKLYGVVSDGQPALVVMEMMHKGNLRDYLRSRRPDDEANVDNLPLPTLRESLLWAGQIADGMAYLESIKFCHRDLAARNCMVSLDNRCKIGDFGMTRDVYVKDYYRPTGKRMMPVRWMAPESLKDAKFTSKSDVWSYGIVIWEIVTLAQQPYGGLGNNEVFSFVVESKKVMERPTGCPDRLHEIMIECWKYDPRQRPTFPELAASLLPDMDARFKEISFSCNRGDYAHSKGPPRLKTGVRSDSTDSPSKADCGQEHTSSPNGVVPLAGSVGTADGSEFADSDTPLNPHGSADRGETVHLQGQDSDGEELQSPICSSNRRGNMPKSFSTPNWARKTGNGSSSSPRIDTTRSASNTPIANGHVPPVSV